MGSGDTNVTLLNRAPASVVADAHIPKGALPTDAHTVGAFSQNPFSLALEPYHNDHFDRLSEEQRAS